MNYEVSSDVPLPATRTTTRWPWASMNVGDSFLVQDIGDRGSIASAASYYAKRHQPDRSTAIREVRATERDDGNYADVTVLFVKGGGERFPFVVADDLIAMLDAGSIGKAYWQQFRKKYRSPERIEEPALCGAWMADDSGVFAGACPNVMPCETHGEGK